MQGQEGAERPSHPNASKMLHQTQNTPVIPATQEVETRGSKVQGHPGLHSKTVSKIK
jgi:hypothetical protein